MGRIARLLILAYIPKREYVESGVACYACFDRINRHQHDPRDGPHRQEDTDDHPQEANEEVRVQAVGGLDRFIVTSEHTQRPSPPTLLYRLYMVSVDDVRMGYPAVADISTLTWRMGLKFEVDIWKGISDAGW